MKKSSTITHKHMHCNSPINSNRWLPQL